MIYARVASDGQEHIRFCAELARLHGFELRDATPELPHFCLYNKRVDSFRPLAILSVSLAELQELRDDPGLMFRATVELIRLATLELCDRGFPHDPRHDLFATSQE